MWPSQEIKQGSLAYGAPIDLSLVGEIPVNHGIAAIALLDPVHEIRYVSLLRLSIGLANISVMT